VNIKIRVCRIIGPAAAGSAGLVPTGYGTETSYRLYEFQLRCYRKSMQFHRMVLHYVVSEFDCALTVVLSPFYNTSDWQSRVFYYTVSFIMIEI